MLIYKIFIFYANPYSFTDERTGQIREGTTIQYILAPDLRPHVLENGARGYQITKESHIPKQMFNSNLQKVPGVYNATFKPVSRQGNTVLEPFDFEFLSEITVPEAVKK